MSTAGCRPRRARTTSAACAASKTRLFGGVGPSAHRAAPLAVRWVNEAGYAPAVGAAEAALDGVEAFAEDVFFQLLDVVGLPGLPGLAGAAS